MARRDLTQIPPILPSCPLARTLKWTVDRVRASDVSAGSAVAHWIVQVQRAFIRADRVRRQVALNPTCQSVILRNSKSGRGWWREKQPIPLLRDHFLAFGDHIGRQDSEHTLAVLQKDAVQIDQVLNT